MCHKTQNLIRGPRALFSLATEAQEQQLLFHREDSLDADINTRASTWIKIFLLVLALNNMLAFALQQVKTKITQTQVRFLHVDMFGHVKNLQTDYFASKQLGMFG